MFHNLTHRLTNPTARTHTLNAMMSGLAIGFLQIMIAFSLSSLLFSGQLAPYLSHGIGMFLIGTLVGTILAAIFSGTQQLFPAMQSSLVLILVGITSTLTIAPNFGLLPTTIVLISLTALLTGVIFYLFGSHQLIQFIRYVPYPVIGGFLAGNGLLLIQGALLQGMPPNLSWIAWLQGDGLIIWLPSLLIGIALVYGAYRNQHYAVMPVIVILSVGIIHGLLLSQGISTETATQMGILVGDLSAITWQLPFLVDFSQVDWSAIGTHWVQLLSIAFVGLIHMSLNLSSLEVIKQENFNMEAKSRVNGFMNIASGLLGGNVLFYSASLSTLNHRLGTKSRLSYLVSIGLVASVLFLGTSILSLVPVSVLGGLLIFLGVQFLQTWVINGWKRFTRPEYGVVLLIMVTVAFVGILEGFILGIIMMVIVFVGMYTRISIIYRATSGASLRSTIEHTPHYATILESLRNQIYVIELTGFLFFGTGNSIVTAIENRLADGDVFRYLLIDFRRVRGMDSSALLSLNKVMLMADQHDFDVYICDLANNERAISIIQGVNHSDHLVFADTLDSALGACETILLEVSGATQAHIPTAMRQQLVDLGMSKENAKALSKYMTREVHKPQETIIQQGDNADCVYLLEIGQVSIFVDSLDIDSDPDVHIGLRTMRFGTIIGEVGFVLKQKRSATIITDTDCIIWSLTHNDLERLREENPQLGFSFENVLLRILAKRLTTNNQLIQVLR